MHQALSTLDTFPICDICDHKKSGEQQSKEKKLYRGTLAIADIRSRLVNQGDQTHVGYTNKERDAEDTFNILGTFTTDELK
jgi:hypothetical protein